MLLETLIVVLQALHFNWPLSGINPKKFLGEEDPKEGSAAPARPAYKLHTVRLGVWELVYVSQSRFSQLWTFPTRIRANVIDYLEHVPLVVRFFREVYALAPRSVVYYFLNNFWESFQGSLSMYFTSKLLDAIGERLQGKELDKTTIAKVLVGKLVSSLLTNILIKVVEKDLDIVRNRVKYQFMLKTMKAVLKLDIATADDPSVANKLGNYYSFKYGSNEAWEAFVALSGMLFSVTRVASQLLMTFALIRKSASGPTFVAMCALQPIIRLLTRETDLWNMSYVSYCVKPELIRMASMHGLAYNESFRADRLSDGAGEFIEKEFIKNRELVGDTNSSPVEDQWFGQVSFLSRTCEDLLGELPLLLFAFRLLFDIDGMSVTSLSLFQQMSSTISQTVSSARFELQNASRNLSTVKDLYASETIENIVKDGDIEYPLKDNSVENGQYGTQVEFRGVSFAYPNTSKNALTDVSFTIKPGQMVVIVGVNGSGKSSLIKLFNRLYDPTSGCIFLDGRPISDYRLADIRRTMAILRQDHYPYPVSLRENIALGLPGREVTQKEVESAMQKGGATNFISKLDKGLETVLHPVGLSDLFFRDGEIPDLKSMLDGRDKSTEISGGESQRLAASRTFMRLSGGDIRFVAADEPTSALDPEGEYELFSRLKKLRGKQTIVFITHRFGHLTRHADLILCMKDGVLVEQGTHDELVAVKGEYYKLHDVQARAFTSDDTTTAISADE
ncbi:hypothetical protein M0805_001186 [Coniferiporia weirii]|nr:hypothetical protein M0805_001186 [Coniferiporia weirii]